MYLVTRPNFAWGGRGHSGALHCTTEHVGTRGDPTVKYLPHSGRGAGRTTMDKWGWRGRDAVVRYRQ